VCVSVCEWRGSEGKGRGSACKRLVVAGPVRKCPRPASHALPWAGPFDGTTGGKEAQGGTLCSGSTHALRPLRGPLPPQCRRTPHGRCCWTGTKRSRCQITNRNRRKDATSKGAVCSGLLVEAHHFSCLAGAVCRRCSLLVRLCPQSFACGLLHLAQAAPRTRQDVY
jgi:hypothetical protein